VAVLLTDDPGIREINKKFRGLDAATNVLSFPGGPPFPGEKAPHLGDVALSVETVLREAAEGDRPAGEVLYFYLVHGLTHLLGYDHCKGPLDEKAQELEQERLLALIPLDL
jgi:probable rRNA maturation factor